MANSRSQLKREILNCSKCGDMLKSRNKPVPGVGSPTAKIVIVGLAPGKDGADLTGIPFTRDPSGELIDELMASVGLSREQDAYITNLVKCNPKDLKGCNRPPSKAEIENCCRYLTLEIDCVKPLIIVTLGKDATEFLLQKKIAKMGKIHGQMVFKDGVLFLPFIHPGFVVRGAYDKKKYLEEFKILGETFRDLMKQESCLSRLDILLLLINKGSDNGFQGLIKGKTKLQKLLFLVQNELKKRGYKAKYAFRPYLYGPYSRELYTDIEWLRMKTLVDVRISFFEDTGLITTFAITESGKERVNTLKELRTYKNIDETINCIFAKYGQISVAQLVDLVHKEFSGYHKPAPKGKIETNTRLDSFVQNETEEPKEKEKASENEI